MDSPAILATRKGRSNLVDGWDEHDRLAGRLGVTVPRDWWASPPLLKSFEAAGFAWTQVEAPPASVLRDPRQCVAHSAALAAALATTRLGSVVHAPGGLRLGSPDGDRAFEGLLSWAAEIGAARVVYHALALPDEPGSEEPLRREAASLRHFASRAERRGLTIAIENLAPLYPGPQTISSNPLSLRGLALRSGSEAVGLCLDLGHAHIVAELLHTSIARLVEPVLDLVTLFHLHDNFGAREHAPRGEQLGVDPLRLDLHLPPGRGSLPWREIAPLVLEHEAPAVLEIHPPYRPRAAELHRATSEQLAPDATHLKSARST